MDLFSYPVFLSLQDKRCLVIGYGNVGRRKLRGLLSAGPSAILVLDPHMRELDIEDKREQVSFARRSWTIEDIVSSFLVFAATGDVEENARIAEACARAKTLCNSATEPAKGDFILPAVIRQPQLCLALSTQGASPLLAKKWKNELEAWVDSHKHFLCLMQKLRPIVLRHVPEGQRPAYFARLANSHIERWLASGQFDLCRQWCKDNCPELPQLLIDKIFMEYESTFR